MTGDTMTILEQLTLGLRRKLRPVLQSESSECGLACLCMIADWHGFHSDLASMRNRFQVSQKGMHLQGLMQSAQRLGLHTRALKLDLADLRNLRLPCILHWEFNHFVILEGLSGDKVRIIDPAIGRRELKIEQFSHSFTGVALELWPAPEFRNGEEKQRVRLRDLVGQVHGMGSALIQVIMLALALEIFVLVNPLFLQWVIDHVVVSADYDLLAIMALGFAFLTLVQHLIGAARSWVLLFIGAQLNLQWRANVLSHLLRLPVHFFEKRHIGDLVSRTGAVDVMQRTLTSSFIEALLDGVMVLVIVAMMMLYSPLLSAVALGYMALYALLRWSSYHALRSANEEHIVHSARQNSHFLETLRGIKAIKLFQRQHERNNAWQGLLTNQINADLRGQKYMLMFRVANSALFGLAGIAIIWLGAKLVLAGNFSVGAFMAFHAYKVQFNGRTVSLIDKLFELHMLQLQGERLADIVLSKAEDEDQHSLPHAKTAEGGGAPTTSPMIEVKNLRYRYSEQEPWVLDGLNASIRPGESLAITGPSGCGKSTFFNLLLGVLPATEGEILIDGKPLHKYGLSAFRQQVACVMQDDSLFAGSLAENICFFDPQPDLDWAQECARMASIHEDISAMPMGYNTLVGDMGTVLSGGQKQRVLLARALYRRPRVLFLDEATSHLDPAREQQVNAALKQLSITRISIAHRTETIQSADRILAMDQYKTR
ncbi:peptidase domain-containing ABC transporter [Massilia sp. W12]|uniref:peptidase domain-containing ABC transporter n=1 Tax=Massilia sp. W12 TaxID=3126507 RepID=UPI0030D24DB3